MSRDGVNCTENRSKVKISRRSEIDAAEKASNKVCMTSAEICWNRKTKWDFKESNYLENKFYQCNIYEIICLDRVTVQDEWKQISVCLFSENLEILQNFSVDAIMKPKVWKLIKFVHTRTTTNMETSFFLKLPKIKILTEKIERENREHENICWTERRSVFRKTFFCFRSLMLS